MADDDLAARLARIDATFADDDLRMEARAMLGGRTYSLDEVAATLGIDLDALRGHIPSATGTDVGTL